MSWLNGPWRSVARQTHLSAKAQRRLWRLLIVAWTVLLAAGWAGLSALTRAEEKAGAAAGQTYMTVAPLAAEVMDLRERRGQLEGLSPLEAAERVARTAGIGPERLRLAPAANAPDAAAPVEGLDTGKAISLKAQGLNLRELVELLRDLRVEAGLNTQSAHMAPARGAENRMDLDMVLSR